MNEVEELVTVLGLVKDLKREFLKKRHWIMIFKEMGIEKFNDHFNLIDLQNCQIQNYLSQIKDIMLIAEKEYEPELRVNQIENGLDALKFNLI